MSVALETMPAARLHRKAASLNARHSVVIKNLIEAGRGMERGFETRRKTDPLSLLYIDVTDSLNAVNDELDARRRYHGGNKPIRRGKW